MDTFQLSLFSLLLQKNIATIQNQQYQHFLQKYYQHIISQQNNNIITNILSNYKAGTFSNFNTNFNFTHPAFNIFGNSLTKEDILLGKKRFGGEESIPFKSEKTEDRTEYVCKNQSCNQKFFSLETKFFHEMNCEHNTQKIYECKHKECNLKFKTKRQLIVHHNKFERECLNDKNLLIKLIGKYKKALDALLIKYNIKVEELKNTNDFVVLNEKLKTTYGKIQDREFFDSFVGENIEY